MKLAAAIFATFFVVTVSAQDEPTWWQHTTVYQIYPRSYVDSDGDGTGDLKGIESKLDYFVELGVETIWLSPIFKSPMKDFGYDISDFKDIDPIFGTLDDFKSLLDGAHERDLKILLDFVPNHSSDEHEWFIKSVAREEPYTDYYVWADPKGFDDSGNPIPPNNWVSVFRGSAWEYNEQRQQFYLHQFVPGQPDLNYNNPAVLEAMKDVIAFWLDLGVDGFRMDAVAHIAEADGLPDEPISGNSDDPNDYGYLNHIYTQNLPATRDVLGEFYKLIKSYAAIDGHDRISLLEVYLSPEEILPYYEVGDFPFNFQLLFYNENPTADDILQRITSALDGVPEGKKINWVLGNHDQWRIGSRTRPELMDTFNLITMTLPGVAVTYQGEEIGMTNGEISFEDTVDPAGCNCGPDKYDQIGCSRDPERTPMQWSANEPNAGFSTADKTWLPVNPNYVTVNVDSERDDPLSSLNIFKTLIISRLSDPAFDVGQFKGVTSNNMLAYSRTFNPTFYPTYVTLANFNNEEATADFSGNFGNSVQTGVVYVSTKGTYQQGSFIDLNAVTLAANEGALIYLQPQ